ncbi:MAG: TonB-dependent receptor [Bacteroidales bacterium]|nr:TonB-dependent receptor [Bacteroidales bacterium]
MMKRLLLLFILLPLFSFAQNTGSVSGIISDNYTSALISGAEIKVLNNKGGVSNEKGYYSITNIPIGTYSIVVKYLGYETQNIDVTIIDGKNVELNIAMFIDIKELLAVDIRDDKIETHSYSKVVLREADLEQRPIRDIADYMREVPNISAIRKGGANLDPVIRGFKFSQLNVQLDNGQKIEGGCPNRMDPTTAHVEAGDIEAIEVYKGPFALRFGENMGGVVNLLTSSPRPFDEFQLHVKAHLGFESNWNGQRQHMTVYGGGKKVFFSLSGNNAAYGDYTDGDGNKNKSSFSKYGYTAKLGFAPVENHKIILSFSDLYANNVDFPALPMDERLDATKYYSADYSATKVSDFIETINAKVYFSDVDHTMDNKERGFGDTVIAVSNIIAKRFGYRAEVGINTSNNSHLFVGTDMYKISKDGTREKTMIGQNPMNNKVIVKNEKLWNNASITNYGAFMEYRYNYNLWEAVVSSRIDFNSSYSDSISLINGNKVDIIGTPADSTHSSLVNFSISAGLSRKIGENMSIGLSAGRGVRSPDMLERFIITLPVGYDNYEYIGNPLLKAEVNNEIDIIYKYQNQTYGGIELTAFYSFVQNYIGGKYVPPAVQKPLTKGVLGVKKFENIGNASIYGFELTYATPRRYKFRASVTAAITQGTLGETENLIFDANGKVTGIETINNDPVAEIPPFNTNINLSYNCMKGKLMPSLNLRYSGSQNRISVSMQELTTPDFALLDASIKYKYNQNLSLIAGVNNILNKTYYEHLNRRILGTNERIYEPGRVLFVNLILNF